jgi:hypothetical protein
MLGLWGAGSDADAEVVYTYTGNNFDSFHSTYIQTPVDFEYDTTMSVTGSFTVPDALAGNLVDSVITPTSFTFSDGRVTWDETTVLTEASFIVSTDNLGNIVAWAIHLASCTGTYNAPFPQFCTLAPPDEESEVIHVGSTDALFAGIYDLGQFGGFDDGASPLDDDAGWISSPGSWSPVAGEIPVPVLPTTGIAILAAWLLAAGGASVHRQSRLNRSRNCG